MPKSASTERSGASPGHAPRAKRQLQISIPAPIFRAFADRAGRIYDYSGGARRALFLESWDAYRLAVDDAGAQPAPAWPLGASEVELRTLHFQLRPCVFRAFASRAATAFDFAANARAQLFVCVWRWRCERDQWSFEM